MNKRRLLRQDDIKDETLTYCSRQSVQLSRGKRSLFLYFEITELHKSFPFCITGDYCIFSIHHRPTSIQRGPSLEDLSAYAADTVDCNHTKQCMALDNLNHYLLGLIRPRFVSFLFAVTNSDTKSSLARGEETESLNMDSGEGLLGRFHLNN